LILVMPMAGLGTRVKSHFDNPKPFIEANGMPLFAHALSGLPLESFSEIIFAVNEQDRAFIENLPSDRISRFLPRSARFSLMFMDTTTGQAETVLKALEGAPEDEPLLIAASDTIIRGAIPSLTFDFDGALGVFTSSNPGMSYVETNNGLVTRAVEKVVISDMASSGVYYFSCVRVFREAYSETRQSGEKYVAPLYNSLIARGMRVGVWFHEAVIPLGTSEEILSFESEMT
jgi:NDP-sugar pyrophosphorylase family protein